MAGSYRKCDGGPAGAATTPIHVVSCNAILSKEHPYCNSWLASMHMHARKCVDCGGHHDHNAPLSIHSEKHTEAPSQV